MRLYSISNNEKNNSIIKDQRNESKKSIYLASFFVS